VDRGAVPT